jgi:Spy/CpxP family protein refolding chaperone
MKRLLIPIAVAILTGSPLVAAAQQPTRPMRMQNQSPMPCPMGMHGMMMGMMGNNMMRPQQGQGRAMMRGQRGNRMGGMMSDSSLMVQMKSQLGLSDEQLQKQRTIQQRTCAAAQPHMRLAMQAHQAAMQALQGDSPDMAAYKGQLDQAARHMVEAQVEMAKGMVEFRESLTAEQRRKLDQMHQQMMRGAMGSDTMPDSAQSHTEHHPDSSGS